MTGPATDPVTAEIVRGAIAAAQGEMEALIERTAISAFIREKKDFYTAVFDAEGVMAVGSMVPIFGDVTTPVFEHFPADTMQPGDIYWYNDCYASRGAVSHSNDQVLLAPVFHAGQRVAFVMSWAHFDDIGGLRPGSISSDATEIFQEGIIVPPIKLSDRGTLNDTALAIFYRNARFPETTRGDMSALLASVRLGSARMEEIAGRFGPPRLAATLEYLLDRTRNRVRDKLAETFEYGTHRFTDAIDSDGQGHGPFRLRFALTRAQEDGRDVYTFDARETDDQAQGPVNLLMNRDVPGMALGLFYLGGDPSQVCNAGGPQAIDHVLFREGSLVQPKFPAPLGLRGLTMMRALAALNGLVNTAGGTAPAAQSAYVVAMLRGPSGGGPDGTRPFLLVDGIGVGYGARHDSDGIDAVYFVAQENYPAEFLESSYPVRLRRYGIVADSGGAGRQRGGCGIIREYEILCEKATLSIRIDSVENPPWGIDGGLNGGTGQAIVNPDTPAERVLTPLSDGNVLHRGDILRIETGGGGGFGHPHDRPAERVATDVLGGFVTEAAAAALYGVALRDGAVDAAATARLRATRPPARRFHRKGYVDALA